MFFKIPLHLAIRYEQIISKIHTFVSQRESGMESFKYASSFFFFSFFFFFGGGGGVGVSTAKGKQGK